MDNICKFEKVSKEQFSKNYTKYFTGISEESPESIYNDIKLPVRATNNSAGYDFFIPYDLLIEAGKEAIVPTGIKVHLDNDKFLAIYPRSGLGFKYKLRLSNTVGIIDADYINADNEGHIFIKLSNEGDKDLLIKKGQGIAQGIIQSFFVTCNDDKDEKKDRTGGLGSTSR